MAGSPLQRGMRGDEIRRLHDQLSELGLEIAAEEREHGVFGGTTAAAICAIQRQRGLPETGVADATLLDIIIIIVEEHRRRHHHDHHHHHRHHHHDHDHHHGHGGGSGDGGGDHDEPTDHVVQGTVFRATGGTLQDTQVRAYSKALRHELPIAQTKTNQLGQYRIVWKDSDAPAIAKGTAALEVRAFDADGKLLAVSSLAFRPGAEITLDLIVGGDTYLGSSEYEQLVAAITPALDGVTIAKLTDDDLSFLSQESDFGVELLTALVAAARLNAQTDIPEAAFYGLFRKGQPQDLPSLLLAGEDAWRAALQAALADNVVPAALAAKTEAIIAALRQLANSTTLGKPAAGEPATLGAALSAADINPEIQAAFLDVYQQHDGPAEQFWAKLAADPRFAAPGLISNLQTTVQLTALTLNHPPLVTALRSAERAPRDLVKLSETDWRKMIDGDASHPGAGVPPEVPGPDEETRRDLYAKTLVRLAHDAFPTAAVAVSLSAAGHLPEAAQYIDAHPALDLERSRIAAFVAANPPPGGDASALVEDLSRLQRVLRVARAGSVVPSLVAAGFDSAHAIARLGAESFASQTADLMSRDQALAVHARATAVSSVGHVIWSKLAGGYNRPALAVTSSASDFLGEYPSLETLFGPMPLCNCPDCQSVLSPAAYLVDLFHFIWMHDPAALEELHRRRPELPDLQLTCDNTLTPLPYIDLVNEVLENAVLGQAPPKTNQTTWTAPELLANPEYIEPKAYNLLSGDPNVVPAGDRSVYPWSLPFDFWTEEARVYLTHLGVERLDLMELLRGPKSGPTDEQVAQEFLRITPREWDAIATEADDVAAQQLYWGTTNLASLADAAVFLQHSGLRAADLPALFDTYFVNPPDSQVAIGIAADENCDPSASTITGLLVDGEVDPAPLDRIHRFVRLWRHLGWTMAELDQAIHGLGDGVLNEAVLLRLVCFERLRRKLSLPVIELLVWWTAIGTTPFSGQRSQYEQLFFDNTVANPAETTTPDTSFDLDLTAKPPEILLWENAPAGDKPLVRDHLPRLLAGLQLTADDAASALDLNVAQFRLSVLSQIFRTASLCRALDLPVRDFDVLRSFIAHDPFNTDPTQLDQAIPDALAFVAAARKLLASPFALDELAYLFHDAYAPDAAITDDAIGVIVDELRAGLKTIAAQTAAAAADPDVTAVVRRQLAVLLTPSDLPVALDILEDAPGALLAKAPQYFSPLDLPTATLTALETPPPDHQPKTIAGRYLLIRDPLLEVLAKRARVALVRKKIAEAFGISIPIAVELLYGLDPTKPPTFVAPAPAPANTAPLDVLLADVMTGSADTRGGAFAAQFATLRLLFKQALIASRLRLRDTELEFAVRNVGSLKWPDLTKLPIDGASAAIGFDQIEGMLDYVGLRDKQPVGTAPLTDVFAAAMSGSSTLDELLVAVAERTGWNHPVLNPSAPKTLIAPDLQALASSLELAAGDFVNQQALMKLAPAVAMVQRIGLPAAKIVAWKSAITPDLATDIRNAAKAKHSEAEWSAIAKKLRDVLREKQRDALVAYVLGHGIPFNGATRTFADTNELFDFLLVDAEMGACQLTSRIKQAIGATQLFIQRCLMNLESYDLGVVAAKQWVWMRNYRVWEANRKIFLYPENWIEPELRDDKTPFFVDLENDINKNDITDDTAEDAFRNYLGKLHDVARLEVVGVHRQEDAFADETPADDQNPERTQALHIVARTPSTPHHYYYRRFERGHIWTPWEKVDLDINGDHVLPVIWNRRLHLFWALITEKADQESTHASVPDTSKPNQQTTPPAPQRHREVQLAWSEYKNGKWSAKKTSKTFLRIDHFDMNNPRTPLEQVPEASRNMQVVLKAEIDLAAVIIPPPPPRIPVNGNGNGGAAPSAAFEYVLSPRLRIRCLNQYIIPKPVTVGPPTGTRNGTNSVIVVPPPPPRGSIFWESGCFEFSACSSEPTVSPVAKEVNSYQAPLGTTYDHQGFVGKQRLCSPTKGALALMHPRDPRTLSAKPWQRQFEKLPTAHFDLSPVLGNTIGGGQFRLLYPHMDGEFFFAPFFFADDERTFFVRTPRKRPIILAQPTAYLPHTIAQISARYLPLPQQPPAPPPVVTVGVRESAAVASAAGEFATPAAASTSLIVVPPPPPYYPPTDLYQFSTFYHPYACLFLERLAQYGIDGLLRWDEPALLPDPVQMKSNHDFASKYAPNTRYVDQPYPIEEVSFAHCDAYAQYNWELFFHVPFLIANRLTQNQRFEEAQRWYHFIFDPTSREKSPPAPPLPAARYWKVKPFRQDLTGESISNLLLLLAEGREPPAEAEDCDITTLADRVAEWRDNPFNPHLVARERISAYQKAVVIKYLDNLIGWGDQLFRRDTIEEINQATQLYILAAEILGPRPEGIPTPKRTINYSWRDLFDPQHPERLDAFSDELENLLPPLPPTAGTPHRFPFTQAPQLVFCVPPNDKLLAYWDTVADRLFKIRHCLNIEGVARQLPLFEPPIEPGLLVRAAASGADLRTALDDVQAAVPHYRFATMLQKANELCADLRALGSSLLSALEKRDAEDLALLRSGQEIALLQAVKQVKQSQVDDAQHQLDAVKAGRAAIDARQQFYASREFMNGAEIAALTLSTTAGALQTVSSGLQIGAGAASLIPNFNLGVTGIGGSPTVTASFGGQNVASGIQMFAQSLNTVATALNLGASLAATIGAYQRRKDDWDMQAKATAYERDQADRQIAAAEVRLAIAQKDLENQDLQIENAQAVNDFMRSKYTNRDLYDWMVGQVAAIYFQSYQLAYDLARRAERAYRHELGIFDDKTFIQFGYWDNLKQGLLAGERLQADLRRLEATYLDQNARELELTKHVSLALTDPIALQALKSQGQCFFDLDEELFDLDNPGHYLRRIKSISVTIPCVAGPYTSVSCSLALTAHRIRHQVRDSDGTADKYRWHPNDDRFQESYGHVSTIVTSTAQNDAGLFEANLRDERYLPFEGAGAVSSWKLAIVNDTLKQFDWGTIGDVVIHVRYTARDGGEVLRAGAIANLQTVLAAGVQFSSGRHDFSDAWYRFLHPTILEDHALALPMSEDKFPFALGSVGSGKVKIRNVVALVIAKGGQPVKLALQLLAPPHLPPDPASPPPTWPNQVASSHLGNSTEDKDLAKKLGDEGLGLDDLLVFEPSAGFPQLEGTWYLHADDAAVAALPPELRQDVTEGGITRTRINPDALEDVFLLFSYKAS